MRRQESKNLCRNANGANTGLPLRPACRSPRWRTSSTAIPPPSIATLESICAGFGITLAQFFAEGDMVELTEEQKEMFAAWSSLSKDQKDVLRQLILVMKAQS